MRNVFCRMGRKKWQGSTKLYQPPLNRQALSVGIAT